MRDRAPSSFSGAQRFDPSLARRWPKLGVTGRIAVITAGWQEREAEDEDLAEHLQGRDRQPAPARARRRCLPQRSRAARRPPRAARGAASPAGLLPHSARARARGAARDPAAVPRPPTSSPTKRSASIEAIRDLDAWHLASARAVRKDFEERCEPAPRPARRRAHRKELRGDRLRSATRSPSRGGHVASLLNRLVAVRSRQARRQTARLRVVRRARWPSAIASSSSTTTLRKGQARARCSTPGSASSPARSCLPAARGPPAPRRPERVQVMARRFAPASCLAFPARSRITWRRGRFTSPHGVIGLMPRRRARVPLETPAQRGAMTPQARHPTSSSTRAPDAEKVHAFLAGKKFPIVEGTTRDVRLARRTPTA